MAPVGSSRHRLLIGSWNRFTRYTHHQELVLCAHGTTPCHQLTVLSWFALHSVPTSCCTGRIHYAFQEALNSAGDKLVVVDFSATWCGPCKMIKPFFHSLSEKYSNVVFLEVDVDDCQDVASECEVKCMPTFQFFKKGQKVGEFSGANKEKLEATINELI
uniref:Thioredoxin n=1 Tax=Canis lupus familiaris TaxID=9615 RepID=A0A8C0N3R9_CANLF